MSGARPGAIPARPRPLLVLLSANAVSITGNALTVIAVPWFVLETTGSAGRAGLVAFCSTLPVVVAALLGGPAVDRLGLWRTSVVSDLVCAVAVAAVPALYLTVGLAFWQLLVLVAVTGLFHAPGETARGVLLAELAERGGTSLERATSAYDGASRGARMLGAPLAGVLIAVFGAEVVLLVDAATFAVSAVLIAGWLPRARQQRPAGAAGLSGYAAELREGFQFVRRSSLLLVIVVMVMVTNALDQAWGAVLLPLHAREHLGGSVQLGVASGVFGGCALVGTVLFAAFGRRVSRRWLLFWAFLIAGPPRYFVAALWPELPPLLVTMAVGGLVCGAINPILGALQYELVPARLRSRVLGAVTSGVLVAVPIGGLAAGALVDRWGLGVTLLVCGGLYLVTTLSPLAVPAWREADRSEPGAPGGLPGAAVAQEPPTAPRDARSAGGDLAPGGERLQGGDRVVEVPDRH
ncbi:MFS transporter permease [Wenjunlia vitaminophila]|uniref:Multidrug efflux pump Tap n=1 Tax=Wenjunlia vitaminophila TaxID=76728 RepID=A0A0T6LNN9_WENVI|nr:MFS transporter [Wenjunlia vitaminophila]KRV47715.1 MFS transporter permease [Wenjunlia vitaminophila]